LLFCVSQVDGALRAQEGAGGDVHEWRTMYATDRHRAIVHDRKTVYLIEIHFLFADCFTWLYNCLHGYLTVLDSYIIEKYSQVTMKCYCVTALGGYVTM
jgi:hypothetical protein